MASSEYLNSPKQSLGQLALCDNCFQIGDTDFGDMRADLTDLLNFTYNAIEACLADIEAETAHVQAKKEEILEQRRLEELKNASGSN